MDNPVRNSYWTGCKRWVSASTAETSQDIDPTDLQYVADVLRYMVQDDSAALWTMPGRGFDYDKWSLPVEGAGTVTAAAL